MREDLPLFGSPTTSMMLNSDAARSRCSQSRALCITCGGMQHGPACWQAAYATPLCGAICCCGVVPGCCALCPVRCYAWSVLTGADSPSARLLQMSSSLAAPARPVAGAQQQPACSGDIQETLSTQPAAHGTTGSPAHAHVAGAQQQPVCSGEGAKCLSTQPAAHGSTGGPAHAHMHMHKPVAASSCTRQHRWPSKHTCTNLLQLVGHKVVFVENNDVPLLFEQGV